MFKHKSNFVYIGFLKVYDCLIIILSSISIVLYFFTSLSRINYPFAFEWVEGNTYLHVLRILEGKSIYGPPDFEFIPMIYTPFYYYSSAILKKVIDINIMSSMRLLSFISSVIFVCIFILSRQQKLSLVSSFGAVGLFVATYSISGYWFDLGRVDMLYLALLSVVYVLLNRNNLNLYLGLVVLSSNF